MEAKINSHFKSKVVNLLPFIRWNYLEKINPFKEKKILVVGLSKTGTTSLHSAFNILGIDSIHYPQYYELASQDLRFKWHWKFDRSRAFSDIPVVAFLDELLEKYPDSYIVYTSREKTAWLESCRHHFELPAINPKGNALRLKVYGCPVFDSGKFSDVYDQHAEMIKERFKNHPKYVEVKLDQKDKWGELCTLFEVPVPNIDYPHANKNFKNSIL